MDTCLCYDIKRGIAPWINVYAMIDDIGDPRFENKHALDTRISICGAAGSPGIADPAEEPAEEDADPDADAAAFAAAGIFLLCGFGTIGLCGILAGTSFGGPFGAGGGGAGTGGRTPVARQACHRCLEGLLAPPRGGLPPPSSAILSLDGCGGTAAQ